MDNTIVQWNCRGLRANYNEILLLLSKFAPSVVCLQETFLKHTDSALFKNYTTYSYISNQGDKASGGTSIVINGRLSHSQVNLNTPLQAVAVSVTLHKTITICSLYLPPNAKIDQVALNDLIKQLPEPFFLLGDLNGHSPLWGCAKLNDRGKLLEDFIGNNDLSLLNDKSPTYLHTANGQYSSLDLSTCTPTWFPDYFLISFYVYRRPFLCRCAVKANSLTHSLIGAI